MTTLRTDRLVVRTAALVAAALTVAGCSSATRTAAPRRSTRVSVPTPTAIAPPTDAGSGARVDPVPVTAASCLARPAPRIQRITATVPTQLRVDTPAPSTTFDLRDATFTGDDTVDASGTRANIYPILLGKQRPAAGLCVLGGTVPGRIRSSMTWPQLKAERPQPDGHTVYYDGAALTAYSSGNAGHLVDGLRVDDVADGVAARGSYSVTHRLPLDGDNFFLRDAYFTNVRDDCVDVNELTAGTVYDSLLDGCYSGISERPNEESALRGLPARHRSVLMLDHVLLRMQRFPGPHPTAACRAGTPTGYNQPFKWSPSATRLVVRHTLIALDGPPCSERDFPFPRGAEVRDTTIVWTGPGRWRWPVPAGVHVTTDRSAWVTARATWLRRHGCPDPAAGVSATANACTHLVAAVG